MGLHKKFWYLIVVLFTAGFSSVLFAEGDLLGARCDHAVRMAFVYGDVPAAEKACQSAMTEAEKEDPPGERLVYPLMKLGSLYAMMGLKDPTRYDQALPLVERALTIREVMHGPADPSVAQVLALMAPIYASKGRFAEAETCYKRVIESYENSYGAQSLEVAGGLRGYAGVLRELKREHEANELDRHAETIYGKFKKQERPE